MTAITDPFYKRGYHAYTVYLALELHFRSDKYDYIKYRGHVNASEDAYLKRSDKYWFAKFARDKSDQEIEEVLLSNILERGTTWIGNLNSIDAMDTYMKWLKYYESFTYSFSNDLDILFDGLKSIEDAFKPVNNQVPRIVKMVMQGDIHIETLAVLDALTGFTKHVDATLDDPYVWKRFKQRYDKYRPFVIRRVMQSNSEEKIRKILKETLGHLRKGT